jgi:hypothetical protein
LSPRRLRLTAFLCFTGAGLVLAVRIFRLLPAASPPWLVFVTGVLPNFGGALFVPFVILAVADAWSRRSGRKTAHPLPFAPVLAFSFLGLTAWEFVQHAVWNLPVDPFDIAASAVGTLVSAALWRVFKE